jgi:hypothetical protein
MNCDLKTYYSDKYPSFSVANYRTGWIQLARFDNSELTEDPLILREIEMWASSNSKKFYSQA